MRKLSTLLLTAVLVGSLLASCNLPFLQQSTGAVQTSAALTVEAHLTAAAAAAPPTSTTAPFPSLPPVTATVPSATMSPPPTSASSCDKAQFVSETVPDDTIFSGGDAFLKTWTLRNIGTCSWTPSYSLVFVSGDVMSGPATVALSGNFNPGQTATLSVNLTAPSADGTYHGNWGLRNAAGIVFSGFWVQIKVSSGGGGGGTPAPFAVVHVTYTFSTWSDSGHVNCPRVTANITTNQAGTVTYHWTRSDGGSNPTATLSFGSAGTQSVNYDWALGSVWNGTTFWVGIYIDSPNHQDFGHQTFTQACTSP
jgi:hypothetical protein